MLLKLLRNFHSSASNIKNLNKLWDNFSSQVESAEDSQAIFISFSVGIQTLTRVCAEPSI